jgi:hypothetical protein
MLALMCYIEENMRRILMPEEYLTRRETVEEIRRVTGCGRYVIDRKIDVLVIEGKIVILTDPGDRRKQRISRSHIQVVIESLQFQ